MARCLIVCLSTVLMLGYIRAGVTQEQIRAAFGDRDGAFVLRDCASGVTVVFNEETADKGFGPCSTFKIWNSLIGLEEGLIGQPDDLFWTWDGEARGFAGWNKDQTWRSAFASSCVPAFQELARKIGAERMQSWLDNLGYGNRDMAGRADAFWLPRAGQNTIMITPREQAGMICRMLNGKLPVKAESVAMLTEVMKLDASVLGTLYGKTGSGLRTSSDGLSSEVGFDMGWLVGFVDSSGKKYAYACLLLGEESTGKDARRVVEAIFKANRLL